MIFRLVLHSSAKRDLDTAYQWAARHAPLTAAMWVNRFQSQLKTLQRNPQRCPFAPGWRKFKTFELRQWFFGRRGSQYRVVFAIDRDSVRVLRILRAQRRSLSSREIWDAWQSED